MPGRMILVRCSQRSARAARPAGAVTGAPACPPGGDPAGGDDLGMDAKIGMAEGGAEFAHGVRVALGRVRVHLGGRAAIGALGDLQDGGARRGCGGRSTRTRPHSGVPDRVMLARKRRGIAGGAAGGFEGCKAGQV